MILIDYSGVALAAILVKIHEGIDEGIIRHRILNSIRMYRKKHKKEFGEIVICVDGDGEANWRKQLYPQYKANRTTDREKSHLDWDLIYSTMNLVREEIHENFPYMVLRVKCAEADDIIARLIIGNQEFGEMENNIIISADHDFKQLQVFSNVTQWSPQLKKPVIAENPKAFLREHIIKGDKGDGVPNVLTDDLSLVEGRRQKSVSAKKLASLVEDPRSMGEDIFRNYLRNKAMIDLSCQPDFVVEAIISMFESQKDQSQFRGKIYKYLVKNQCRKLLGSIEEFTK